MDIVGPGIGEFGEPSVDEQDAREVFDFESHRISVEAEYRKVRGAYADFSTVVKSILEVSLENADVLVHSIEERAKSVESFGKKAIRADSENPDALKYDEPLKEITDLAAARVITFFLSSLAEVDDVIKKEFSIVERNDKGGAKDEARLGYQSIHYLVRLNQFRLHLPEYMRFSNFTAEIQVRTILQHAWAEIEHDIQYKSVDVLPALVRRRFLALAGMLEIGDREFQAIADDHKVLREEARARVASGDLRNLEITSDSLKALLDKEYGEDGRMREFSYDYTVRLLKALGFTTLKQVSRAVENTDDDQISRILNGSRMGQLTRFEDVLLARMGEKFKLRHPWGQRADLDWFGESVDRKLGRLSASGITVGDYDPAQDVAS
ncbi:hypothetical protein AB0M13_09770 [Nocardia fluminea]|uniref:GTP pyrophosphokinase n=1 Tax=Nocardia fluminea TaxID=134984 RepID=UPI00343118DF